jgi:hypothetical protein
MIQGPSTSDDLSLSSSSSSSVTNSLWVNEGANDMNLLGDHDEDLPPAAAEEKNNNNVNVDTNIIIGKDADDNDASSISESSFNGYAALANLDEEEWEDLHDIQTIARQHDEKWRKQKLWYQRKEWDKYEDLLVNNANFYGRFRMSKKHFDYLVDNIRDCITVDYMKSMNSTKGNTPLSTEVVTAIGLQCLGQGHNKAGLADIFGFSDSTIVRARKMFVDAIDFNETCPEL